MNRMRRNAVCDFFLCNYFVDKKKISTFVAERLRCAAIKVCCHINPNDEYSNSLIH